MCQKQLQGGSIPSFNPGENTATFPLTPFLQYLVSPNALLLLFSAAEQGTESEFESGRQQFSPNPTKASSSHGS